MKKITEKAGHIQSRFPEKIDAIEFLMAEDREFCEICEDYETCAKALHYWIRSPDPEAGTLVEEYRTIIQELEADIAEALAAWKPVRSD